MYKLVLPPDSSGYTVSDELDGVVRNILEGGAARYRRDIQKTSKSVQCTFICTALEYQYLRAFYRTWVDNPSGAFLADLVIDGMDLTTHSCYFIPGTFILTSQQGGSYTVQAQLEVRPLDYDTELDSTYVALVGEYGLNDWQIYVDLFDIVINVEFPPLTTGYTTIIQAENVVDMIATESGGLLHMEYLT